MSGTVTSVATGGGVANVSVWIYSSSNSYVTDATTDASGNYTSRSGLTSGTYYARTSNSLGLVDGLYNGLSCVNCNVLSGTPIGVSTGATTPNINFALAAGGRISGTVTSASRFERLNVSPRVA